MKLKECLTWFLIGVGLALILGVIDTVVSKADTTHKIIVAIVDTGLDLNDIRFKHLCDYGHKDFTNTGIRDYNGHGTHISGIIEINTRIDDYCYIIVKYFDDSATDHENGQRSLLAMKYAVSLGVDIINYSSSGDYISEEYRLIKTHPNIIFNVAAGNDGLNLDRHPVYPCSYNLKNIHCVGRFNGENEITNRGNYGKAVKYYEPGWEILSYLPNNRTGYLTGTSQATAMYTSQELNGLQ